MAALPVARATRTIVFERVLDPVQQKIVGNPSWCTTLKELEIYEFLIFLKAAVLIHESDMVGSNAVDNRNPRENGTNVTSFRGIASVVSSLGGP